MRRAHATAAALSALVLAAGVAGAASLDPQDYGQIERGRYLTTAADCTGCHTLPGSGHQFAGGRAIETPFGKLIAPNITPDPDTGIGAWTDDEFVDAMTKGTGRDGGYLYPAMPYAYYTKLSRNDALAIRAYLKTIPSVRNEVHANQLPFPFDIRTSMAVWDRMFFTEGAFHPVDGKSAEWNRGAYLAEGVTHCGMCHTPKNILGGDRTSQRLQGYALQGWFAPDITNDSRRGVGGWSVDDIAEYLKTGHNRTSAATGLMSEMITLSTSHMTDADLRAIAVYLKDQGGEQPQQPTPQTSATAASMKAGESIYADECSGCHTPNGKGSAGLFPSLNGSPVVQQSDPTSLIHVVLRGAQSTATDQAPTAAAMPAFGWIMEDDEIAAVLTYVRNAWGNAAPPVDASDVTKARKSLEERSD